MMNQILIILNNPVTKTINNKVITVSTSGFDEFQQQDNQQFQRPVLMDSSNSKLEIMFQQPDNQHFQSNSPQRLINCHLKRI